MTKDELFVGDILSARRIMRYPHSNDLGIRNSYVFCQVTKRCGFGARGNDLLQGVDDDPL